MFSILEEKQGSQTEWREVAASPVGLNVNTTFSHVSFKSNVACSQAAVVAATVSIIFEFIYSFQLSSLGTVCKCVT